MCFENMARSTRKETRTKKISREVKTLIGEAIKLEINGQTLKGSTMTCCRRSTIR